jgi:hypothetical protein
MDTSAEVTQGPRLPSQYIKIIPHPSSASIVKIVPIHSSSDEDIVKYIPKPTLTPWAPFKTRQDFEYTASAIRSMMPKDLVNMQLSGIHGSWSHTGSTLTIRNYDDMHRYLDEAKKYFTQVRIWFQFLTAYELTMLVISLIKPLSRSLTLERTTFLSLNIVLLGKYSRAWRKMRRWHLLQYGMLYISSIARETLLSMRLSGYGMSLARVYRTREGQG